MSPDEINRIDPTVYSIPRDTPVYDRSVNRIFPIGYVHRTLGGFFRASRLNEGSTGPFRTFEAARAWVLRAPYVR